MIRLMRWTPTALAAVAGLFVLTTAAIAADPGAAANRTVLGPNVYVFDPSMPAADMQHTPDGIFKKMEANQFGPERYALLFKPGVYNDQLQRRLLYSRGRPGTEPRRRADRRRIERQRQMGPMATGIEQLLADAGEFRRSPSSDVPYQYIKGVTRIAISQAAPLRRLHVKGELQLFDWGSKGNVGYASGGFLADSVVDGSRSRLAAAVVLAQQQLGRLEQRRVEHGLRRLRKPAAGSFPDPPYTVVDRTPVDPGEAVPVLSTPTAASPSSFRRCERDATGRARG